MPRYAWVLEVRPGYEEEYVRRHQEIWPEMVDALRSAGISNYSIFRHGLTRFSYFETDDIQKTREYLANDETNRRWSEWMDPIMKVDIDSTTDFPSLPPCNGTYHSSLVCVKGLLASFDVGLARMSLARFD